MNYLDFIKHINLLRIVFLRDVKAQYIHNTLGLTWLLLNPLFTVLLYSFVFSVVLKIKSQGYDGHFGYAVFLLAGMIPYLALNESIQNSVSILNQKKDLVIKSVFPAGILPFNCILLSLVSELLTLFILLLVMIYNTNGQVEVMWLFIPVAIIIRCLFSLAISWWLSVLSIFLPDIRQVINSLLPAWMFLTPILYSKERAPDFFQNIQLYNPLAYIVDIYRSIILDATWPEVSLLLVCSVLLLLNVIGYCVYKALLPRAKDFI